MGEVKFSVRITVIDLFRFLIQHSYRGVSMIINILITVGAFVFFFKGLGTDPTTKTVALLVIGLIFPVLYPLDLLKKAYKQSKNPIFKEPLCYTVNDEGITLEQGEQKESFSWEGVYQIRETKHLLAVYTNRVYACIWPKRELSEKEQAVKELFAKHLDAATYKKGK